jgi:flavodoxin
MKKIVLLLAAACTFVLASAEDKPYHFKPYGFIRNYAFFDTRATKSLAEDVFFFVPLDEKMVNGNDVNAVSSYNYQAITTRLGLDILGYQVGNTKIVADYISDIAGADQFEIVTHKYDGMAYTPLINLAQEEAKKGELPPYEGKAPDLSQYDTVFIGGPVWWGTYPQVMFTLFRDINLDGKTVIPFTTHEGSGLANCASDVKKSFPKAKVAQGFSIYGHEVRSGRSKVEKWLKGLGY